jgi:hypothetical protein
MSRKGRILPFQFHSIHPHITRNCSRPTYILRALVGYYIDQTACIERKIDEFAIDIFIFDILQNIYEKAI